MNIIDLHSHLLPKQTGSAVVDLLYGTTALLPGHWYSVGIHPWHISDDWHLELAKKAVLALHHQVLMIGETGLDKKKDSVPLEVQREVFNEQIRLSELVRKPMLIHCVKAIDELLFARKSAKAVQPWILHGFRGNAEQACQLHKAGIYVSFGEHYDTEALHSIPHDCLFLESDASGHIDAVYECISNELGISRKHLETVVSANTSHLFNASSKCPPLFSYNKNP